MTRHDAVPPGPAAVGLAGDASVDDVTAWARRFATPAGTDCPPAIRGAVPR